MKTIIRTIILLTSLIAVAITANAQAIEKPKARGFYVEGNVGWGNADINLYDSHHKLLAIKHANFAWNANFGYKFTRNLAIEGGYTLLPNVQASNGDAALNNNQYLSFIVKGMLPIAAGFSVFGKFGPAMMFSHYKGHQSENSARRVVGLLGVGVGYAMTPHWQWLIQGTATSKGGSDNNNTAVPATFTVTGGMSYIF